MYNVKKHIYIYLHTLFGLHVAPDCLSIPTTLRDMARTPQTRPNFGSDRLRRGSRLRLTEPLSLFRSRCFLFLVTMPGAPNSFLFLVVRPGATSKLLAPNSDARSY